MEPPASASSTGMEPPASASSTGTEPSAPAPAPASAPAPAPASASASTSSTSATISSSPTLAEAWRVLYPPTPARAPAPVSSSDAEAAANLLRRQQQLQALEVFDFEGVDFVRLRLLRSGRPAYLHASEDGRSVRLDPRRESYNAVWAVTPRLYPDMEINCVLLRGAYGRYLGAPDATACDSLRCLFPSPCCAAKQRDGREYDRFEVPAILWRAVEKTSHQGAFLLQDATERYLCANSRCLLPCCSGLHVSARGTATHWAVERVPRAAARPDLPEPTQSLFARVCQCQPLSCLSDDLQDDLKWLVTLACQPLSGLICGREIRWVRAAADGTVNEYRWSSARYTGRLTIHLKTQLVNTIPVTLCVRAGRYGELSPLVVNLPRSRERLDIVFLDRNTVADDQLIYPDVNVVEEVAAIPEPVL
ncbi:unnamed protein product [Alopecurus aequalis]